MSPLDSTDDKNWPNVFFWRPFSTTLDWKVIENAFTLGGIMQLYTWYLVCGLDGEGERQYNIGRHRVWCGRPAAATLGKQIRHADESNETIKTIKRVFSDYDRRKQLMLL